MLDDGVTAGQQTLLEEWLHCCSVVSCDEAQGIQGTSLTVRAASVTITGQVGSHQGLACKHWSQTQVNPPLDMEDSFHPVVSSLAEHARHTDAALIAFAGLHILADPQVAPAEVQSSTLTADV